MSGSLNPEHYCCITVHKYVPHVKSVAGGEKGPELSERGLIFSRERPAALRSLVGELLQKSYRGSEISVGHHDSEPEAETICDTDVGVTIDIAIFSIRILINYDSDILTRIQVFLSGNEELQW